MGDDGRPAYVPPRWRNRGLNRWMAADPPRLLAWYVLAPLLFAAAGVYALITGDTAYTVLAFLIVGFGRWQLLRFGPAVVRAIREGSSAPG